MCEYLPNRHKRRQKIENKERKCMQLHSRVKSYARMNYSDETRGKTLKTSNKNGRKTTQQGDVTSKASPKAKNSGASTFSCWRRTHFCEPAYNINTFITCAKADFITAVKPPRHFHSLRRRPALNPFHGVSWDHDLPIAASRTSQRKGIKKHQGVFSFCLFFLILLCLSLSPQGLERRYLFWK